MAIIFESIYLAKNIISLQIKAHEVYIKPLKPRESILEIKESDDEDDYESDHEDKPFDEDEDNVFEDLIYSDKTKKYIVNIQNQRK